mmetsp:Transcript_12882/g.30349  ORF Transcript_12882/g.30349 Transcript_12882/m.30349 type:complete len:216 (+) Transcript_12882:43-690(+)
MLLRVVQLLGRQEDLAGGERGRAGAGVACAWRLGHRAPLSPGALQPTEPHAVQGTRAHLRRGPHRQRRGRRRVVPAAGRFASGGHSSAVPSPPAGLGGRARLPRAPGPPDRDRVLPPAFSRRASDQRLRVTRRRFGSAALPPRPPGPHLLPAVRPRPPKGLLRARRAGARLLAPRPARLHRRGTPTSGRRPRLPPVPPVPRRRRVRRRVGCCCQG